LGLVLQGAAPGWTGIQDYFVPTIVILFSWFEFATETWLIARFSNFVEITSPVPRLIKKLLCSFFGGTCKPE
jgi:hypothetical protein